MNFPAAIFCIRHCRAAGGVAHRESASLSVASGALDRRISAGGWC
jgi:hypothetical protein